MKAIDFYVGHPSPRVSGSRGHPVKALILLMAYKLVICTLPVSYRAEARVYLKEDMDNQGPLSVFDYFLGGLSFHIGTVLERVNGFIKPFERQNT